MDAEGVDAEQQADPLGLGEQQDPPRLTGTGAGRTGIQDHPGALPEGHRNAQVSPYLHLLPVRAPAIT